MDPTKPAGKAASAAARRMPPRPPGRPKGVPNKITTEFREAVAQLLRNNAHNVQRWLQQVAEQDPDRALQRITMLAEYAAPKLARVEHSGEDGGPLQVVIRKELPPDA